MRGWSQRGVGPVQQRPVVPAHAGLVPARPAAPVGPGGGPRACGVGPNCMRADKERRKWSPRMRGWSPGKQPRLRLGRVVPAHAGLVPTACARTRSAGSGPRVCGVGPPANNPDYVSEGWSPRMRGWSLRSRAGPGRPACGPRACGVGPVTESMTGGPDMWSPRMRGWSQVDVLLPQLRGVVPAHAGLVPTGPGR